MRFTANPYSVEVALELEREAGFSRPVSTVLARRGITTPDQARDFVAASDTHDPGRFEGMAEAVRQVADTIEAGGRITVYGDFDCDGVCATTVLAGALRELGAECDWFIPDRIADGYGLNPDSLRLIAERGTSLVVTVDCGVTAVNEVALARELGMEILVTDHHQPGPELPDCLILHPVLSGYDCPDLCGAAVAAKLATALRRNAGRPTEEDEADLDLVALATVADVMPLTGENRHLVREGVKVARLSRRAGMSALINEARVEPSRLSARDFAFRLGPRINAAGRMYRADAGVELLLADSKDRAAEIARELSAANAERRRVEREVESEAKAALRDAGDTGPAIVVAGRDWHPGVIGIVASRLARAEGRPAVVISLDGETGRGSARSVSGLDLHAAIGDASDLLESFGGHAAAAGLSIKTDLVEEFRRALGDAVEARIGGQPLEPVIEFDAVVAGADLGLDLAEELEQLAPFGNGNPSVNLLIPGAKITDLREMGEGKHCRFSVESGSHRAAGVCFGRSGLGVEEDERIDVVAELNVNHFNGSISPQLQVKEIRKVPEADQLEACDEGEWWQRFEAAMGQGFEPEPASSADSFEFSSEGDGLPGSVLAGLISSGERILVITADSVRRWADFGGSSGLGRFMPGEERPDVRGLWAGSPAALREESGSARLLLMDFPSLRAGTVSGLSGFDRIALIDPPFSPQAVSLLNEIGLPVHFLAGRDEFEFTRRVVGHRFDLTHQLRGLYRKLRDSAQGGNMVSGEALRKVIAGPLLLARSPEQGAVLLRVLEETGLARSEGAGSARAAGVVSSERTELTESSVFVHHSGLHKEQVRFLDQLNRQIQNS
ncbi:MAG TPA: single-stranded-DNA-specific exonuclease RecJ [Solirubrobacterales bacterium]|nr:single-stranded-DNA-specific exonuclease RecJ [Solirubrobacterales bacterium]